MDDVAITEKGGDGVEDESEAPPHHMHSDHEKEEEYSMLTLVSK